MKLNPIHRLTFHDAEERIISYVSISDFEFQDVVSRWKKYLISDELDENYSLLRQEILKVFQEEYPKCSSRKVYPLDLKIGLKLYELLNQESGFTYIDANDDDVWRYLSVIVFPDITYLRYPEPEKGEERINRKRFYSHTRRIWLKTLWWYVFLAWQGDVESTFKVLENNGSNVISHFIETPGKGYRLLVYRALMLEYSKMDSEKQKDKTFRAIAKLKNAKMRNVEPALMENGEEGFAKGVVGEISEVNYDENDGE